MGRPLVGPSEISAQRCRHPTAAPGAIGCAFSRQVPCFHGVISVVICKVFIYYINNITKHEQYNTTFALNYIILHCTALHYILTHCTYRMYIYIYIYKDCTPTLMCYLPIPFSTSYSPPWSKKMGRQGHNIGKAVSFWIKTLKFGHLYWLKNKNIMKKHQGKVKRFPKVEGTPSYK